MTKIRIHITDDHAVFRCGLKAFIEKESELSVVSEATDASETLLRVRESKPDVVILDINIPGRSAASLTQTLLEESPKLALLILTIHDEEHYLREFLRLGARGFMVKTSTGSELIEAIRKVHRGEQYIDPQLSHYLIANYIGRPRRSKVGVELLSAREREICQYLASGHTNAEVAEVLNISKRTVETHRAAIMAKLGLKSRAELVHFAMENGLWPQRDSSAS
jgi:two-component system, NarL family, response regulator NreC